MLNQGILTQSAFGQSTPPPPPPPDVKGSGGNREPLNAGAPIRDGAWILLALVAGYGIHTFKVRIKKQKSDIQLGDSEK